MVHFKVSAVLPIPAHIFFVERDSAAFRSLVAKVMKLGGLEILDGWMDGDVEVYKFVTRPDIEKFVPKGLQHYLPGGNLYYIDIIEYDPEKLKGSPYILTVNSIPPIFPNKAHISCQLTIEEETKESCRQTLEGDVDIKIFGLGSIAEKIIAENLKKVYSGIPKIVERWVEFRKEVLKHPRGKEILVSGRPDNHDIEWIRDQIQDLLREPLQPAYDLAEAPGMTQQLHEGKTAKDIMQVMEKNQAGRTRGFDEHGKGSGKADAAPAAVPSPWGTESAPAAAPEATADASDGLVGPGTPTRASASGRSALSQDDAHPSDAHSITPAEELTPREPDGSLPGIDSDEEFEDAHEDLPWTEETTSTWTDDPHTADQIAEDHKAATTWLRSFKQAKQQQPDSIIIDHDVAERTRPPLNAKPLKSKRFSTEYQKEYQDWTGYWDKQDVPEQEHVPEMRARLGHLFGLGAAWGLLKPQRSAGHSRTASGGNPNSLNSHHSSLNKGDDSANDPTASKSLQKNSSLESGNDSSSSHTGSKRHRKVVPKGLKHCFVPKKTSAKE